MKHVLVIAGSDGSGGAGIQGDLKTVDAFGAWGMSVVTAVTVQNTKGVSSVCPVPADAVAAQMQALLDDMPCHAVKIGMLNSADVVDAVVRGLKGADCGPVVLDPVFAAGDGSPLLDERALPGLINGLMPLADLVTPNVPEAEQLSGITFQSLEDMCRGAQKILDMGPGAVLVKGGHLPGRNVTDVLVTGPEHDAGMKVFHQSRLVHGETPSQCHGTGCALSSAIAAGLAQGAALPEAVDEARRYVRLAMRASVSVGQGQRCLAHNVLARRRGERYDVLQGLKAGYETLCSLPFASLIPEIQTNFAHALSWAEQLEEVAAFPGRIIKVGESIAAPAPPGFGASRHIARIVLTVMRYDPAHRACLNIRYTPDLAERLSGLGFQVASFDRAQEPMDKKIREGSSLEWGTDHVLRQTGGAIPDAIYDRGDVGKEPVIRILGRTPEEVVEKVARLCRSL